MPNDDVAKFPRRLPALICSVVCIAATVSGAGFVRASENATEFTITDGDKCDTVHTGKPTLSGTLKIKFAGRILPHENTKVVLYGKGVSSLTGKFDRVEVPQGWVYDLTYDYEKPEVVIKNFRPDHPP